MHPFESDQANTRRGPELSKQNQVFQGRAVLGRHLESPTMGNCLHPRGLKHGTVLEHV
jgi:hypothetical protein